MKIDDLRFVFQNHFWALFKQATVVVLSIGPIKKPTFGQFSHLFIFKLNHVIIKKKFYNFVELKFLIFYKISNANICRF